MASDFEVYYTNTFYRRKVSWIYNLGKVEVSVLFPTDKNYTLYVTPLQFSALDLFNSSNELTLNGISNVL